MNCCIKCFNDIEIQSIIESDKNLGNCDFCNSKNIYICNIDIGNNLKDNFDSLLDTYIPIGIQQTNVPNRTADLISNILHKQWSIFELESEKIHSFLVNLLPDRYAENADLFNSPVVVRESLKQYSMLSTFSWEDFVGEIKNKNRFHTATIQKGIFEKLLRACSRLYPANSIFYRARIWTDGSPYPTISMGAPPAAKASAGRANPEGISCLYLADSIETTLHETRAGLYDYATVGTFVLSKDIQIVDLTNLDKISPFNFDNIDLLAANLEHLKKIGDEISRPLRKHDSSLDYLPTQYICDYVKSIGFAGIQYKSTMHDGGVNFAIFDEKLLECVGTINYDISSIQYGFDQVL